MRKLLLLTALTMAGISFSHSQQTVNQNINWQQATMEEKSTGSQQKAPANTNRSNKNTKVNSRSVSSQVKLNSQPIGTAGNLLSVEFGNCKQIDVNDSINTVIFIHRNDPNAPGGAGTNVAQYRFDKSTDGGNTWNSNIGPITNSSLIDNVTVNGRFPQGGIYNPIGNTIPDSALLIYSGTWHNSPPSGTSGSWQGQMRGRGNLSGDTSTFNVHIDQVNNGMVDIASGFCQSTPGVFWNLNQDFSGTFVSGSNQITYGLLIEKGVWDPTTKDVTWTLQNIPQTFDSVLSGSTYVSEATSFNMAFDPSGQYGWIGCLGAIDPLDSSLNPIFWRSVDSGATWTGPIVVNLANIPEVVNQLHALDNSGNPTSRIPSTAFDENIVVDYLGNPHMIVVVGNRAPSSGYALTTNAGYSAWDITYSSHFPACEGDTGVNGWRPLFIDSVETLRGTFTKDNPPLQEDNRPMACRTRDGKKVFFYWLDSDINIEGSDNNSNPNLFTRAFDLVHFTSTNTINLTLGDSLWGGTTTTTPGGLIGGATFGVSAEIAHQIGSNSYNVPFVLTQIDYTVPPGTLGSADNPAAFWYINNINYDPYDFVNGLSASVSLIGSDSVILLHGNPYVDLGAQFTYLDTTCYKSGTLHLVVDTTDVNPFVDGSYYVHYLVEDDSGNVYAATNREVTVGSPPVAFFTFTHSTYPYKVQFLDGSLFNPTTWFWEFGDGTLTYGDYPNPLHVYHQDGVDTVCLTVYNSFGSGDTCMTVNITKVGIDNIAFDENVTLYPNPSSGRVSLNIAGSTTSELSVSVLDVLGKEVVGESRYQAGTTKVDMDLSSLASGVYLVKVTCETGTAIKYLNIDTH